MHKQETLYPNPEPSPRLAAPRWRAMLPQGVLLPAPDLAHSRVVHESWRDYLRGFPAGARILDIAAGIGAISLLAQEVSRIQARNFEVHSLDQAATLAAEPLLLDGIHFHARRYDKSTSFEDGYFDAINAQWAPPDGDTVAPRLAELRRILRQGGRARFMFHALGGAVHQQCQGRSDAVEALLGEFRLLEHARHMFEVAFTQETALRRDVVNAAMLVMDSHRRYAEAVERVRAWNPGTPNPQGAEQVVQVIANCWERRASMSYAEIKSHLDSVEADLRSAQARLQATCALAVDETRAHRIGRLFKAAGFAKVKVWPFREPETGSLLGWELLAV